VTLLRIEKLRCGESAAAADAIVDAGSEPPFTVPQGADPKEVLLFVRIYPLWFGE
jgi:hypothetical protein